jgi:hypothetical protein
LLRVEVCGQLQKATTYIILLYLPEHGGSNVFRNTGILSHHYAVTMQKTITMSFSFYFMMAYQQQEKCNKILVAKSEGKRPLGRPKCR